MKTKVMCFFFLLTFSEFHKFEDTGMLESRQNP